MREREREIEQSVTHGPQLTSAQCLFICFMHYEEVRYCDNVFCGSLLQWAGIVLC